MKQLYCQTSSQKSSLGWMVASFLSLLKSSIYLLSYFMLAKERKFDESDYDFDDDLMEPEPPLKRTVPTVFGWEHGGREVLLSGSFNDWKTRIPMNLRSVIMKSE